MSTSHGPDAPTMRHFQQRALSDEADRDAIFEVFAGATVDSQMEPFFDVLRHWLSESLSTVDDNTAHAQYFCIETLGASVMCWKQEVPWSTQVVAPIWADTLLPWVGQYFALIIDPPDDGHGYLLTSSGKICFYLSAIVRQISLDVTHMDSERKSAAASIFAIEAIPIHIIKSAMRAYIHAAASSLDDVSIFEVCCDMLHAFRNSVAYGRDPRIHPLWLEVLGGTSRTLRTLCSQSMVRHLESGAMRSDYVMMFVIFSGMDSRLWRRTFMAHDIVTRMISTTKRFLRSSAWQGTSLQLVDYQLKRGRCIECCLGFFQSMTSYEGLRGVMDALKCNIIHFLLKCDAGRATFLIDNDPDDCHPAIDEIFDNIRKYMVHPAVLSSVARARYHNSRPISSRLVAACSQKIQFHWYSMMVKEAPVLEMAVSAMLEETPTIYRVCANSGCPSLHRTAPTKCCIGCRQVFYHSEACQRSDWPNHRDACLLAAEQFLNGYSASLSQHWTDYFHCYFHREVLYGPQSARCKRMWHAYLAEHQAVLNDPCDIMFVLDYSKSERKIDIVPSVYPPSEFKERSTFVRWCIPWDSADGLYQAWGEAPLRLSEESGFHWCSD